LGPTSCALHPLQKYRYALVRPLNATTEDPVVTVGAPRSAWLLYYTVLYCATYSIYTVLYSQRPSQRLADAVAGCSASGQAHRDESKELAGPHARKPSQRPGLCDDRSPSRSLRGVVPPPQYPKLSNEAGSDLRGQDAVSVPVRVLESDWILRVRPTLDSARH
jgi:hypothetical protein